MAAQLRISRALFPAQRTQGFDLLWMKFELRNHAWFNKHFRQEETAHHSQGAPPTAAAAPAADRLLVEPSEGSPRLAGLRGFAEENFSSSASSAKPNAESLRQHQTPADKKGQTAALQQQQQQGQGASYKAVHEAVLGKQENEHVSHVAGYPLQQQLQRQIQEVLSPEAAAAELVLSALLPLIRNGRLDACSTCRHSNRLRQALEQLGDPPLETIPLPDSRSNPQQQQQQQHQQGLSSQDAANPVVEASQQQTPISLLAKRLLSAETERSELQSTLRQVLQQQQLLHKEVAATTSHFREQQEAWASKERMQRDHIKLLSAKLKGYEDELEALRCLRALNDSRTSSAQRGGCTQKIEGGRPEDHRSLSLRPRSCTVHIQHSKTPAAAAAARDVGTTALRTRSHTAVHQLTSEPQRLCREEGLGFEGLEADASHGRLKAQRLGSQQQKQQQQRQQHQQQQQGQQKLGDGSVRSMSQQGERRSQKHSEEEEHVQRPLPADRISRERLGGEGLPQRRAKSELLLRGRMQLGEALSLGPEGSPHGGAGECSGEESRDRLLPSPGVKLEMGEGNSGEQLLGGSEELLADNCSESFFLDEAASGLLSLEKDKGWGPPRSSHATEEEGFPQLRAAARRRVQSCIVPSSQGASRLLRGPTQLPKAVDQQLEALRTQLLLPKNGREAHKFCRQEQPAASTAAAAAAASDAQPLELEEPPFSRGEKKATPSGSPRGWDRSSPAPASFATRPQSHRVGGTQQRQEGPLPPSTPSSHQAAAYRSHPTTPRPLYKAQQQFSPPSQQQQRREAKAAEGTARQTETQQQQQQPQQQQLACKTTARKAVRWMGRSRSCCFAAEAQVSHRLLYLMPSGATLHPKKLRQMLQGGELLEEQLCLTSRQDEYAQTPANAHLNEQQQQQQLQQHQLQQHNQQQKGSSVAAAQQATEGGPTCGRPQIPRTAAEGVEQEETPPRSAAAGGAAARAAANQASSGLQNSSLQSQIKTRVGADSPHAASRCRCGAQDHLLKRQQDQATTQLQQQQQHPRTMIAHGLAHTQGLPFAAAPVPLVRKPALNPQQAFLQQQQQQQQQQQEQQQQRLSPSWGPTAEGLAGGLTGMAPPQLLPLPQTFNPFPVPLQPVASLSPRPLFVVYSPHCPQRQQNQQHQQQQQQPQLVVPESCKTAPIHQTGDTSSRRPLAALRETSGQPGSTHSGKDGCRCSCGVSTDSARACCYQENCLPKGPCLALNGGTSSEDRSSSNSTSSAPWCLFCEGSSQGAPPHPGGSAGSALFSGSSSTPIQHAPPASATKSNSCSNCMQPAAMPAAGQPPPAAAAAAGALPGPHTERLLTSPPPAAALGEGKQQQVAAAKHPAAAVPAAAEREQRQVKGRPTSKDTGIEPQQKGSEALRSSTLQLQQQDRRLQVQAQHMQQQQQQQHQPQQQQLLAAAGALTYPAVAVAAVATQTSMLLPRGRVEAELLRERRQAYFQPIAAIDVQGLVPLDKLDYVNPPAGDLTTVSSTSSFAGTQPVALQQEQQQQHKQEQQVQQRQAPNAAVAAAALARSVSPQAAPLPLQSQQSGGTFKDNPGSSNDRRAPNGGGSTACPPSRLLYITEESLEAHAVHQHLEQQILQLQQFQTHLHHQQHVQHRTLMHQQRLVHRQQRLLQQQQQYRRMQQQPYAGLIAGTQQRSLTPQVHQLQQQTHPQQQPFQPPHRQPLQQQQQQQRQQQGHIQVASVPMHIVELSPPTTQNVVYLPYQERTPRWFCEQSVTSQGSRGLRPPAAPRAAATAASAMRAPTPSSLDRLSSRALAHTCRDRPLTAATPAPGATLPTPIPPVLTAAPASLVLPMQQPQGTAGGEATAALVRLAETKGAAREGGSLPAAQAAAYAEPHMQSVIQA
ncbi:hypothetical protein ACSSS7_004722 [Eimeria intestinalis]